VYGWHLFGKPVLGINSLDLVQRVLSTDFTSFVDRLSAGLLESGGNLDKVGKKGLERVLHGLEGLLSGLGRVTVPPELGRVTTWVRKGTTWVGKG
jgi:hypothetical protein